MPTLPTQIRIDATLKQEATELFKDLGIDMSAAVNMFLRQCILHDGIPFSIERPSYKKDVIAAMNEARHISRDPNVKSYTDLDEIFRELEV